MKKRGFVIILSILLLFAVIGCSKKGPVGPEQIAVAPLSSEESREFAYSLPNIRDAVASTFGSLNIFFGDFVSEFDAKKVMLSPSMGNVAKMNEKVGSVKETLNNVDLIISDFNKKRAAADLKGSDAVLADEIANKLAAYSANKAKIVSCAGSMEKYAKFMELTAEREELIKSFTLNMEKAGNAVDKENYDDAINLGSKAKSNLQRLKAVDTERGMIGVVEITSDVLMSWDVHLEAMDIIIALWNDLKANNMNAAMEKAQLHYNTFSRANKYGETELPVADQATAANIWLNSNIGSCKGLI